MKLLYRDKKYVSISHYDENLEINETLTINTRDHRSISGFGFVEIIVETYAPNADSVRLRIRGFLFGPILMRL